ncbi:MAG: glycosyltransferase family 39 protein [Anaerolineales bacterium]|nr:glycosyltransferase family 39 protein [Anaerolineales bacterium]
MISKISRRTYLAGLIAILLLAAAMRLYALTADAPIYLTRSQDLNTDGPNTIGFARNWVLFGAKPLPYVQPALTWLAYFFFSTLGIGYWQANFIAVTGSLLAIVFIAAFAHQHFGRRAALVSAFLITLNFPFLIYNRIPMVYTPLAGGLAVALYCWGRGLRRSWWFFLSGLATLFCVLYIKIAGVTFLAAAVVGLLILAWRRWQQRQPEAWTPLLLFLAGAALMAGIGWFHLLRVTTVEAILPSDVATRTFNPQHGLEENVRFALVSVLQFGIYSGFFVRIFVLFALAYGYLFYRGSQLLGKTRSALPMSQVIVLLYLIFTILMLLASNSQPFRFMIALIPPMSLAAALALETWLRSDRIVLPARFGRFQLVVILMSLTYFLYQFLAGAVKLGSALYLGTSLVDYQVILDLPILFAILIVSLFLALAGILAFIWWLGASKRTHLRLPSPAARGLIALLVITAIALGDLYQYWAWARGPQFSIIEASRQITLDVGQKALLGGSYAYVLTLENDLPAEPFYSYNTDVPPSTIDPKITHIAVDADSVLKDAPFNEEGLYKIYPEDMKHAKFIKSYTLRGYLINLYQIER